MKRSPVKRKPRRYKVSKSGQVTQNAAGMYALRMEVFERSGGRCENTLTWLDFKYRCPKTDGWEFGEMHHRRHRARGGSDVIENLFWVCRECHRQYHDGKIPFEPWEESSER